MRFISSFRHLLLEVFRPALLFLSLLPVFGDHGYASFCFSFAMMMMTAKFLILVGEDTSKSHINLFLTVIFCLVVDEPTTLAS